VVIGNAPLDVVICFEKMEQNLQWIVFAKNVPQNTILWPERPRVRKRNYSYQKKNESREKMPKPGPKPKKTCSKGHDISEVGRYKSRNCKECKREYEKERREFLKKYFNKKDLKL
jgi:hypothetical protein